MSVTSNLSVSRTRTFSRLGLLTGMHHTYKKNNADNGAGIMTISSPINNNAEIIMPTLRLCDPGLPDSRLPGYPVDFFPAGKFTTRWGNRVTSFYGLIGLFKS